jgi:NitT/TauT family transport system permease protein
MSSVITRTLLHAKWPAMTRTPQRLIVPLAFLVIWEFSSRMGVVDAQFVPAPSTVVRTWWVWIFGSSSSQAGMYVGNWVIHAGASARRVLIGFAIAAVIGVPIGIAIGWYKVAENLLDPLIQMTRPIPMTAWVPFAVVFFGIREPSAISLIALGAFYPIVLNAAAGAQRTPKVLVRAGLMLGMSEAKLLPKVVVPAALPSVVIGLRLGVGVAWVLVIVSEMLAVKSGLGYVLWDAYYFLKMDIIIAAMVSVGILGFISDRLIVLCGNRLLLWSRGMYESR